MGKEWCCRVHGKGCPNQGGGCVTSSDPYDCDDGFANWMAGWSVAKKAWCCANRGKGCPPGSWRLRLSRSMVVDHDHVVLALGPSSGADGMEYRFHLPCRAEAPALALAPSSGAEC